ncbi:5-(carboxyamino)imidazole ribonucleotide mutase [Thioalkalivibrio sp. HK1]|uniref:5-(carboxyamino)imidazole ribonucleotide mutase n=1 Tax=Thioalkalivibrio sp. HK1 TaxID=1469245 RepID=UPI00046EA712|nr:5-(carboxyamino)imidazole ribonucleotide mutase [Thioalkalivibrio sp. HK1]
MKEPFVSILMGSDSDFPIMESTVEVLEAFDVRYELRVRSAHRTPEATGEYVRNAVDRGCALFIAAAGMAAHLAGSVAAMTVRPVIGVPIDAGPLRGEDALLSTVQMPGGIPVASVAIGKAGAKNAGYLAVQILSLSHPDLAAALAAERERNAAAILERSDRLQEKLADRTKS